jgi:hypothetical protein
MRRFMFLKSVAVDTPSGAVVPHKAGDVIGEGEILAGSLECCLARGMIAEYKPGDKAAEDFAELMRSGNLPPGRMVDLPKGMTFASDDRDETIADLRRELAEIKAGPPPEAWKAATDEIDRLRAELAAAKATPPGPPTAPADPPPAAPLVGPPGEPHKPPHDHGKKPTRK